MMQFDPNLEKISFGKAPRIVDERGSMTKVVAKGGFSIPPFAASPRQVLHSGTAKRGTLRGLHAQTAPYTESKVIASLSGRMYWVVVDLRRGSSTFGRWHGFELSPDGVNVLCIPPGFGHGCLSLTDDVNLTIMADRDYSPSHGVGIAWNDPEIAIAWPLSSTDFLISKEHAAFLSFADFRERHGAL